MTNLFRSRKSNPPEPQRPVKRPVETRYTIDSNGDETYYVSDPDAAIYGQRLWMDRPTCERIIAELQSLMAEVDRMKREQNIRTP